MGLFPSDDVHLHAESRESWSRLWVSLPALGHGSDHVIRTGGGGWERQCETLWHPHQHLFIRQTLKWQLSKREHLPTQNSKTPDVAVEREGGAIVRGNQEFRRHPANGEELRSVVIVISLIEVVTYAEVGNLDVAVRGDEAVASGEVSMDDPLGEEEGHAISHLQHQARQDVGRQASHLPRYWTIGQQIFLQVTLREGRERENV